MGTLGCLRPARPADVVLITIDTLRPDHLGSYGYPQRTSPNIDALAQRGTLFEQAVAQAPHTIPSVLQIMTSRYAPGGEIDAQTSTLAEHLQAQGYATYAVVDNPHFELHAQACGLQRGFQRFYRNGVLSRESLAQQMYKTDTPADAVTAQALRTLRGRPRGQPFFLWVHYMDPHDPYLPPFDDELERLAAPSPGGFTGDVRATPLYKQSRDNPPPLAEVDRAHIVALYDAEIRYVDRSVGELLDYLKGERLLDRSLVVLASDHGESLGEHGIWTHGQSCFDPEIRIPLVVKLPYQRAPRREREPVQALDIFPTVVAALGLPSEGLRLEGRSLLAPERGQAAFVFWQDWQVVRSAEWKLVQQGERLQLFHVESDRDEQRDVLPKHPDVVKHLLHLRQQRLHSIGRSASELGKDSSEIVERLRALGYLN